MKDMLSYFAVICLSIVMSLSAAAENGKSDSKQSPKRPIPPQLAGLRGKTTYLKTLDNPTFEHHDPSNIIRYRNQFYMWYTEHPKGTSGWNSAAYIRCAQSSDGDQWKDIGVAIPVGEKGSIDDKAAITAYVVPHENKYYLFYTALGAFGKYPGITYAVADTPGGPWTKSGKKLLWPSGDIKDWDGTHNDDANIIFYKEKWFLYYKGKPSENGKIGLPKNTRIGVATADNLLGPYKRYARNPVFPGHALTAWVHRDGVASFGFGSFWSEDGFSFVKTSNWSPGTVGLYCPMNFAEDTDSRALPWGLVVIHKPKPRHIGRLELYLQKQSAGKNDANN